MTKAPQLDTATMAAFRMRCWYELGDGDDRHYIQDHDQLVRDAGRMRSLIISQLKRDYPVNKRGFYANADAQAEILVTALLAEHYRQGFGNTSDDFLERSRAILPLMTNKQLQCYLLVLLFFYEDEPTEAMKHQIDHLMSTWNDAELTPEDKYMKELYEATLSKFAFGTGERFLSHNW